MKLSQIMTPAPPILPLGLILGQNGWWGDLCAHVVHGGHLHGEPSLESFYLCWLSCTRSAEVLLLSQQSWDGHLALFSAQSLTQQPSLGWMDWLPPVALLL